MATYIGAVTLRNEHPIFESTSGYFVDNVDRNGTVHRVEVPTQAVEFLQEAFTESIVTVDDAFIELEPVAEAFNLPYTYGHKLRFYAQSVLLVLVARGDAACEKRSHTYYYTIHG